MLLKEICTPDVVYCSGDTRVLDAARLMRQKHVGDLVVVSDPNDERTPLGVVTDRDIVVEVLGNGLDPAKTTLASLLHRTVVIADESEDSSAALERMHAHGVRRLPVVNKHGQLVGILTLDDLLRSFAEQANGLLGVLAKGRHREQHERR